MNEQCANTIAMNNYIQTQEKQEQSFENFEFELSNLIESIQPTIDEMKLLATDYNGYDFTEELKEIISECFF